ncbi:MAG: fumarate hydratase [Candidatus Omnitrophota bacterium]|nr:fumarate hydratase [Candidatus Omnitrophota bacterium]
MRDISVNLITTTVVALSIQANTDLREDVLGELKKAYRKESEKRPKQILRELLKNAEIAAERQLAVCQDTGMPVVFVELGQDIHISGGDFNEAINRGITLGYVKGYLRASIVNDPLKRNKPGYSPAVIHIDIVKGNRLMITVSPKGFGCENKSQLMMFKPTAGISDIKNFIIEAIKSAGPDACPPYVLGVGIGGTADYACLLAKKALLRPIGRKGSKLEGELLTRINRLKIGPMGLGGKATCLGVNIETYPTHIAGLPVCVNISCHALRSATKTL